MRVAVLSDIHGNLAALQAALADVDTVGVDEIWCLGDVVGYGPWPNECCDLIRERATIALCGNHDLAVLGRLDVAEFTGDAGAAARWTAGVLGESQREWLESLLPYAERDDFGLYHASPRDPVWEYVLSEQVALLSILHVSSRVVLVGHSHVPLAIGWDGQELTGGLAPGGAEVPFEGLRWLLNPGSVGQPRDSDPRAAWLLIEVDEGRGTFRRVTYPIAETQARIRAEGLPEALASRLTLGV